MAARHRGEDALDARLSQLRLAARVLRRPPSWGARIEEAWWNYDGARFREEVALAKSVHANCIRLWIEFTAWMADPDKVTERFLDAVKAIDEQGMKTMPCLFNRWHDDQWDYGGLYNEDFVRNWKPKLEYVRTLGQAAGRRSARS